MPADSRLEAALARPGVGVIPYLMAGYPSLNASVDLGRRLAGAGVAAVEVGIPFSDPLADGPVIQRAGHLSLIQGTRLEDAVEVAGEIAATGVPVALMTYVNPILARGFEAFAKLALKAQLAGVIVPDLPLEESATLEAVLAAAGLDYIRMVAPTSSEERVRELCQGARGFVYCVTLTGVTGGRGSLAPGVEGLLARVKEVSRAPIAAGFGISSAEHVRALAGLADAVAVGSALVERVEDGDPLALVRELVGAGLADTSELNRSGRAS